MFNYLGNITDLSHHIIKNYTREFKVAVDGTLGNGGDTDFLSENFDKVYAFDIQNIAVDNYKAKNKSNVECICDSHANIDMYVKDEVDTIIYNLGFLPGGDKTITTKSESTMEAIEKSLKMLKHGGMLLIAVYVGHEEGQKESDRILEYLQGLAKDKFGVMLHKVINRSDKSPYLLVVEKK